MATTRSAVDFGSSKAGLGTVGYQLRNDDGTANGSRITAGIVEQGSGVYSAAAVSIPTDFSGFIKWDSGETVPRVAFDPYPSEAVAGSSTIYGDAGSIQFAITLRDTDGLTPLDGVSVYVSADIGGLLRSQTKVTDALGRVVFNLDAGAIYVWPSRFDRAFAGAPYLETVS